MNTIGGSRQRTAADDHLLIRRVPSLLTRLLGCRLRTNGSWDGGCGSGTPVHPYIRWTSEDLIQILGGHHKDQLTDSLAEILWSLTEVRFSPVQRPGFNGKALVQHLQKDLVVDDVEDRVEVQKDDSADVIRVYRLDDLVMHGDDGGLDRVTRSIDRLAIRKKSLWLDMTSKTGSCSSLDNLSQKREIGYWPVRVEIIWV